MAQGLANAGFELMILLLQPPEPLGLQLCATGPGSMITLDENYLFHQIPSDFSQLSFQLGPELMTSLLILYYAILAGILLSPC